MVEKGLAFLAENTDARLGGKCVIGLAFIKSDQPDHPRVKEAVAACQAAISQGNAGNPRTIYSCGMAVIFLCEHDSRGHSEMIRYYLGELQKRQKEHGGWGYTNEQIGDTSQTQYGALALWEAHRHGFRPEDDTARGMADWLIRSQDPAGGWTYKGETAPLGQRQAQDQGEMTISIGAAAMGSVLIAADLFGILQPGAELASETNVPEALQAAGEKERKKAPPLSAGDLPRDLLFKAIKDGDAWMTKKYEVSINRYQLYYMYSLERYKSFYGQLEGDAPDEPEWYNKGYEWLQKNQSGKGSWSGNCGESVDTGFAILFLQRSTLKSIRKGLGEGTLLSGRGLPARLDSIKLSRGQIVAQQAATEIDDLINMLSDEEGSALDAMVNDPTALVGEINDQNGRRFEQIARGGAPAARVLAVRALGRSGDLDYAPTLIFALTDPDKRVVREARDGLRFISRKFDGYGLPDGYDDRQLRDVIELWKNWYLSIRPDGAINLN
ncbi:hypothetical protein [Posidoniimonas polymericola]|uniref:hypothetical protein n=1 Tax=Posidoniimonas polymericola TaxID=2528002 RepID=UPI0011B7B52A|nr:hypothetical protein [Posidoniimonas polymericola]